MIHECNYQHHIKQQLNKAERQNMKPIGRSQLWKKRLGDWGVNVYAGCEHGCVFCYSPAQPGVKAQPFWMGKTQADWGRHFAQRDGLVEALQQQLRTFTPARAVKTPWGQGRILVSFLCDAYQPMEEKLGGTRQFSSSCSKRAIASAFKRGLRWCAAILIYCSNTRTRCDWGLPCLISTMTWPGCWSPKHPHPAPGWRCCAKRRKWESPFTWLLPPSCRFTRWRCLMKSWPESSRCAPPRYSVSHSTPRETVSGWSPRRWRCNIWPRRSA